MEWRKLKLNFKTCRIEEGKLICEAIDEQGRKVIVKFAEGVEIKKEYE